MSEERSPIFPPGVNPVHVGEYEALSATADRAPAERFDLFDASAKPVPRRYWDGDGWSRPYMPTADDDAKRRACEVTLLTGYDIGWRGLANKPEVSE